MIDPAYTLMMSLALTDPQVRRREHRAHVIITGVSETSLSPDYDRPMLVQSETLSAPALNSLQNAVLSATRYMNTIAVLPTDPDYEARVDKMLAERARPTTKKVAVKRLR